MINMEYAEFYVTNVCNLTCEQCNRYNNHKFKGSYNFDIDLYRPWANKVNLEFFRVLGGEPTLHPNLIGWLDGIRECWPNPAGELVSNGTYLSRSPGLHDALARTKIDLSICIHNIGMREFIANEIHQAFGDCQIVDIEAMNPAGVKNRIRLKTDQGVTITVDNGGRFHNNVFSGPNFQVHNSDPVKAHSVCSMRRCRHFVDGKLYQCGVVRLLPDFLEQQKLPVPEILKQYQPLTADTVSAERLWQMTEPMPQCQVCPEKLVYKLNQAEFKKSDLNQRILKKGIQQ